MDFGIVKIIGSGGHTAAGAVMGTALYMPPEVIQGEAPDARSDLYSLGVTLYERVSGRPPFEADSAVSLMMMHVRNPPPDLRALRAGVPDALIAVIGKALAKRRDDRYRSIDDLAAALKQVLAQLGAARAPGETALERTLPPAAPAPPVL
jgi:serine/threonine-protein kinase